MPALAVRTTLPAALAETKGTRKPVEHARTIHFDEIVRLAIGVGIAQVVVLGAGYDTRSQRITGANVHFFELDLPSVQEPKRERMRRLPNYDERRVSYVPIDLTFSAGIGNGGQRLSVLPELDAVVVICGGNYNDFRAGFEVPARVMHDHVLPLLAAVA